MITKEDVLELHSTIKALEERQDAAARMVFMALEEIKDVGSIIEVLKKEYEKLKSKDDAK